MRSLALRIPPPVVALAAALLMWAVASMFPSSRLANPIRVHVARALALAGVLVVAAGIVEFRRARTTVNPLNPGAASALVVSRIYRFSRNPMYLGFAIVLLAWAVCLSHPLSLLGVAAFVAYMNRFQIVPEERALRALFGQKFDAYGTRVRRWI